MDVIPTNFETFEICREFFPSNLERGHIIFETIEDVIIWKVVKVELLQYDQDEQINHNVLLDQNKCNKENGSICSSAGYIWNASLIFNGKIVHTKRPIFTCRKSEHHYQGLSKVWEIHVIWVKNNTLNDTFEEKYGKEAS